MPTTRSQTTTKQSHIDDFTTPAPSQDKARTTNKKQTATNAAKPAQASKKRTSTTTQEEADPAPQKQKRQKTAVLVEPKQQQQQKEAQNEDEANETKPSPTSSPATHTTTKININRAPVLTLWSASVCAFLYPHLPWSTCLSAGASIASLCAISKGRSIGTVEPASSSSSSKKQKANTAEDEEQEQEEEDEEITIMGFPLHIKDGLVIDKSSKPKPANEQTLESKFGLDEEHETREVFRSCLQTWKGEEEELNKKAFGMYEKFRPDVARGQKGWGRKGELSLEEVERVVRKI